MGYTTSPNMQNYIANLTSFSAQGSPNGREINKLNSVPHVNAYGSKKGNQYSNTLFYSRHAASNQASPSTM